MAQQTAVEWLDNELWKLRLKVRGQEISIDIYFKEEAKLILQSKEMEKQRIINAFDCALFGHGINGEPCASGGKYYTQTYGK
jgi:hypothetical protein